MRRLLATSILIVTLALPSVAHAGPAATGDTGPPAETSPPAVTNETEYRDAITDLSADSSGPHVITLGGPITLVSAVDPEYSGTEDLTIDGNGFVLDGAENSRILKMNTSVALTIEDITMTRGVATGTGTRQGGAVFTTGPLTIRDAVFTANEAKSTDGSGSGGAVYASTGPAAAVTIEDATFIKNAAIGETFAGGGALAVGGVSTLTLTRATFDTNVADGGSGNASGGAINGNASAVDVTDSVFAENGATAAMGGNGGALSLSVVSSVAVQSTALTSNVATGPTSAGGGAMNLSSAAGATLTVEDSTVSGNRVETTTGVADGGGLRINTMPTTIRGSLVSGNRAQSAGLGSWGGGISFNTAASPLRTIQIADSTIIANQATGATAATKGGGVRASVISAATVLIMNNSTVTANTASGASGEGGGLWSKGTSLDHVTLASNTANTGANFFSQSGGGGFTRSVFGDPLGSGDNCSNPPLSQGYNADDDGTCLVSDLTDLTNLDDVGLGQARNNGDLVAATEAGEAGGNGTVRPTMFPLNGSPLVDAIPAELCATAPELDLDQRGVDRPFGSGCDIGAIEAVFPTHTFSDVTPFYEATVRWVTSPVNTPQILSGFGDGTFGQSLNITRGQAARLYYNGAGAPDVSGLPFHGFSDGTAFFDDAITWARDEGLFDGFPDNTFRPNNPINRGNFIRSLYGFAGGQDVAALPDHPFTDVTLFYEDAVKWAKGNGLADGFPNNTFRQTDNINRGNASRTFYNTAQTPTAWELHGLGTEPPNMLFRPNITPP